MPGTYLKNAKLFAAVLIVLVTFVGSLDADITNDLVLHYDFDLITDTNAVDGSGNGNAGVISGASWTGKGALDHGYHFDGIDDRISVDRASGDFNFDESTPFTAALWMQPLNYTAGVAAAASQRGASGRLAWMIGPSGVSMAEAYVAGGAYVGFGGAVPNGQWSHVALTFDGTYLHGYVNGQHQGSNAWSRGNVEPSNLELWIGDDADPSSDREYTGELDDIRVYSRALTASDIQELAVMIPEAAYELSFPFESDTGSNILDSSSYSNDAIAFGTVWAAGGAVGSGAACFDGTDDWIQVDALLADLVDDTNGTIALWLLTPVDDNSEDAVFSISRNGAGLASEFVVTVDKTAGNDNLDLMLKQDGNPLWHMETATGSINGLMGDWFHIALVHDGAEPVLYLNGTAASYNWVSAPSMNSWLKAIAGDAGSLADTVSIGTVRRNGSNDAYYAGCVDEVGLYDRALSSNEVQELFYLGSGYADYNGHYYEFVGDEVEWDVARARAVARGGTLAIPDDFNENAFLAGWHATSAGFNSYWLGANDASVEGTWLWEDSTPVSGGFENWGASSPDDTGGQDYMAMRLDDRVNFSGGMWDDFNAASLDEAGKTVGFIVELDSEPSNRLSYVVGASNYVVSTPLPFGYGTNEIISSAVFTNSVAQYVPVALAVRYTCTGWVGTGSVPASGVGTSVVVTVVSNSSLTWIWQVEYYLDVTAGNGGSLDTADQWVAETGAVVIISTPDTGYSFTGWSGDTNDCVIVANQLTAPMGRERDISASFGIDSHNLTVVSARGTALPAVGVHPYDYGTTVACSVVDSPVAAGSTRYVCTGWVGTASVPIGGSQTGLTASITADSSVTWQWRTDRYLDTEADVGGTVDVADGWQLDGALVNIIATPDGLHTFDRWVGTMPGGLDTNLLLALTMTQGHTVTALFDSVYVPADDEAVDSRRPRFSWPTIPGATSYNVYISREGRKYYSGWTNQTGTTWTPDFDLTKGDYEWWVQGWGPAIEFSAWSTGSTFSVPLLVPGASTGRTPTGVVVTGTPLFTWDDEPNAAWYRVWASRNGSSYLSEWISGDTNYLPASDLPYGTYQWWVYTWSPDGPGGWSAAVDFTYGVSAALAPSGSVTTTRRPTFYWGEVPDASRYQLWITKDGAAYNAEWITGATNWAPVAGLSSGNYSWWVRPRKSGYDGPWSAQMDFTVPNAVPGAITEAAPLADTPGPVIDYSWMRDGTGTWYQMWITEDGAGWHSQWYETGMTTGVVTRSVSGHTLGSDYDWWVRAWSPDGMGPWSAGASFTAQ